jgi:hypothetical protein
VTTISTTPLEAIAHSLGYRDDPSLDGLAVWGDDDLIALLGYNNDIERVVLVLDFQDYNDEPDVLSAVTLVEGEWVAARLALTDALTRIGATVPTTVPVH